MVRGLLIAAVAVVALRQRRAAEVTATPAIAAG